MKIAVRNCCVRCGRCVQVCPSGIFVREEPEGRIAVCDPEGCIACGHCVAACPAGAVDHEAFLAERVHRLDRGALPAPEQVELLLAARRSNRALSQRPVPQEWLDRIVAAADRAPTASNARGLAYTVVTDASLLRRVAEYTLEIFRGVERLLTHPLVRPWLKPLMPGTYRYVPVFERLQRDYAAGRDRILRGATAGRGSGREPDLHGFCPDGHSPGPSQGIEPDAGDRGAADLCDPGPRDARLRLSELYRPRAVRRAQNLRRIRSGGNCRGALAEHDKGNVFGVPFVVLSYCRSGGGRMPLSLPSGIPSPACLPVSLSLPYGIPSTALWSPFFCVVGRQ